MGSWRTCPHDGFYMHQVPLAYMAVFARRTWNPGLPVRNCGLYRLGNCDPNIDEGLVLVTDMEAAGYK